MSYPGIGAIVAVLVFGAAIAQDAVVPAGAGRGPAGVAPREADPATRLRAVAALTRRGGAEAVRELIDVALFDGEARIRRAAVHGLGEIGAPECVGGLEQVFSCTGRRMADTAAHLVDRVFPETAVRQWVLTVPWSLRFRMAFDPELTGAVLAVLLRAIFGSLRRRARRSGVAGRLDGGAVTFVQRFGGAINLNVHFHTLALDGVWTADGEGCPRFVALEPPEDAEIARVAGSVARRVTRLLLRRGLLEDDAPDPVSEEEDLLRSMAGASIRGRIATGPRAGRALLRLGDRVDPEAIDPDSAPIPRCAAVGGFHVHANVGVPAGDRQRLERLCRYVARPPVAAERLSRLDDGRLCYELRHPWRDGTTHVVLEPQELLERLAVLVPRPRVHLVRYHGVLAPAARLRAQVVPERPNPEPPAGPSRGCPARHQTGRSDPPEVERAAERLSPRPRNYSWAELMKRVFLVDVLECPSCAGRLRILDAIHSPDAIRAILECLGLPSRAPPIGAAALDSERDGIEPIDFDPDSE